jgi:hypothetical protein
LQLGSLRRRHRFCALLGILVGHQEEAGGAAGRVDDCVVDCRLDDVDDRLDECARCEVLAGAGSLVRGALAEQFLVGVALDVGPGLRPVLLVDEVDDEPLELGRVLNAVLCLAEDRADDPGWRASPLRIRVYSNSSWSPWASSSRCHEYSSGTICCGFSFRVARSCAILRKSR